MKYAVIIEEGPSSVGAYAPDIPGCVAVGDSEVEALRLLSEALVHHIELMREHGQEVPVPSTRFVEIDVDACV